MKQKGIHSFFPWFKPEVRREETNERERFGREQAVCPAVFVGKPQTEPEVKLLGCGLPHGVASEGQQKQRRGGRECQQGNYISQRGERRWGANFRNTKPPKLSHGIKSAWKLKGTSGQLKKRCHQKSKVQRCNAVYIKSKKNCSLHSKSSWLSKFKS